MDVRESVGRTKTLVQGFYMPVPALLLTLIYMSIIGIIQKYDFFSSSPRLLPFFGLGTAVCNHSELVILAVQYGHASRRCMAKGRVLRHHGPCPWTALPCSNFSGAGEIFITGDSCMHVFGLGKNTISALSIC